MILPELPFFLSMALFARSAKGRRRVSLFGYMCSGDRLFVCSTTKSVPDRLNDGLAARRGVCCREDAVFSRTPNWASRDFILVERSLYERLLGFVLGCDCSCFGLAKLCTLHRV